jgi:hypothetical protein
MVLIDQYVVCKFGEPLMCAGNPYISQTVFILSAALIFAIGVGLTYFIDWAVNSSRKDRVEDMKQALKDHVVSKKR